MTKKRTVHKEIIKGQSCPFKSNTHWTCMLSYLELNNFFQRSTTRNRGFFMHRPAPPLTHPIQFTHDQKSQCPWRLLKCLINVFKIQNKHSDVRYVPFFFICFNFTCWYRWFCLAQNNTLKCIFFAIICIHKQIFCFCLSLERRYENKTWANSLYIQ